MMRKLTFAVLASAMLAACQKTDTTKSSEAFAAKTPDALIMSAKNFFTNEIVTIQTSVASSNKEDFRRHQVNKTPLWEKAYIKRDDTKGDVVIVPLQYEKPLHFKTNFGNGTTLSMEKQSDLWIYKDVSGKNKAEVRIALPDKTYQEDTTKSFTGYLLEEDWAGNSIATYLYKNEKVSLLKKNPLPLNSNNTRIREGQICYVVDWYECDYIQNGIGYNCQYLYSDYISCYNDEDDEGGGGGGGGGGGDEYIQNDFCAMTNQQAQAALNSVTTSIGSNGISNIGQETAPDVNGIIKKSVIVKRHSIKYTFPGGKTATYTLFFPGVIFKTTTNSIWKWESLSFQQIERTAGSNPACLSASVSAIVNLLISADKTKADFTAEVMADLQVSCFGGWVIKTKSDPMDGTYYAYEFQ